MLPTLPSAGCALVATCSFSLGSSQTSSAAALRQSARHYWSTSAACPLPSDLFGTRHQSYATRSRRCGQLLYTPLAPQCFVWCVLLCLCSEPKVWSSCRWVGSARVTPRHPDHERPRDHDRDTGTTSDPGTATGTPRTASDPGTTVNPGTVTGTPGTASDPGTTSDPGPATGTPDSTTTSGTTATPRMSGAKSDPGPRHTTDPGTHALSVRARSHAARHTDFNSTTVFCTGRIKV